MPSQAIITDETVDEFSNLDNKSLKDTAPVYYNIEQNSFEDNTVFDQEGIASADAMKS